MLCTFSVKHTRPFLFLFYFRKMREYCQCCPSSAMGLTTTTLARLPAPGQAACQALRHASIGVGREMDKLARGKTWCDKRRCHAMPCETTNQPMHSVPPRTPHLPNPGSCNHQRPSQTTYSVQRFEHHKQYPTRPEGHPQARSNVYILGSLATHHRRLPEPPPAKTHPISRKAPWLCMGAN